MVYYCIFSRPHDGFEMFEEVAASSHLDRLTRLSSQGWRNETDEDCSSVSVFRSPQISKLSDRAVCLLRKVWK